MRRIQTRAMQVNTGHLAIVSKRQYAAADGAADAKRHTIAPYRRLMRYKAKTEWSVLAGLPAYQHPHSAK